MMRMEPVSLDGYTALAIEVKLPKTTLLVVTTDIGYIMCGALDVGLLNEKLKDRHIIAARATGVRTIEELLEAPLESVTFEAEARGIVPGMKGKDAVLLMR
ncbi:YunC family protein [Paenibacillus sp. TAB 01]|uniref:YunC family protein n=1 Tax=Paenibacillus sp. TAB 01 TaxID=3368988 RepID=UPI0037500D4E